MKLVETPRMEQLARYLDATAFRGSLIAENIANVDTPGYHTKELDFRTQLKLVTAKEGETGKLASTEAKGLTERPDGNNVNIDREGLALGMAQLQFATASQLLKSELKGIATAIHEGAQQS